MYFTHQGAHNQEAQSREPRVSRLENQISHYSGAGLWPHRFALDSRNRLAEQRVAVHVPDVVLVDR